ncbi:DUF3667 domain-containing protein [Kordiimonas sp. SCSIO 12610]|uniref:DUF3667 domain-containing protein n=1 Tax=Kordiimonas sp. SCSIO 12610 TaxID=2829597 RepID=UPI00210ECD6B|nr:DUF3667 domain-containing protein [Kordiimonas sp. SCSIO 12610]UTW53910.1 DUF3667 domain-containing protein [Kordiimonas sp. SCSIO 12610]
MSSNKDDNSPSLIKDFVEEFLDVRKGMLFTLRKVFLAPHKVYLEYIDNNKFNYTNPFKLLVTVVSLLTVIDFVVPTDELERRIAEEWAQNSTEHFKTGYRLGSDDPSKQPSEEKLKEVRQENQEIFNTLFEATDEYPLIAYLVTVITLAIGLKSVFWKQVSFSNSLRLACYISIPINIISGLAIYTSVLLFSIDNVLAYFTLLSSLLTYGLLIFYIFRSSKHVFGKTNGRSILNVIVAFIIIQFAYAIVGVLVGAGHTIINSEENNAITVIQQD